MTLSRTLLLGFVAGATILIGLPVWRWRRPATTARALLNATAVGILVFLVWDVLSAAWEPVDAALADIHDHGRGYGSLAGYGTLFAGGLAAGLLGLVAYESWRKRVGVRGSGQPVAFGPGTMALGEPRARRLGMADWSPARRLSVLIAVGIGLHNLAEGLAIGQSAASGEVALATLLVIGFGLHNATEGFGIVAPMAAAARTDEVEGTDTRPSWGFLLALGLVGGGPTFLGTVAGYWVHNEALSVAFLTLAAGSILYVVLQLVAVGARSKRMDLLAYGVLIGLLAGFVTDAVVSAAGA